MIKFLFRNSWVGYAFGAVVSILLLALFGDNSFSNYDWKYFEADLLCVLLVSGSLGILIETISVHLYIKNK